jgi:hypothetical protein
MKNQHNAGTTHDSYVTTKSSPSPTLKHHAEAQSPQRFCLISVSSPRVSHLDSSSLLSSQRIPSPSLRKQKIGVIELSKPLLADGGISRLTTSRFTTKDQERMKNQHNAETTHDFLSFP